MPGISLRFNKQWHYVVLITVIYNNSLLIGEITIKNLKAYHINTYWLWGIEFTYYFKNTLENLQISIWTWFKNWKIGCFVVVFFLYIYNVSLNIKQPQFRWYIVKDHLFKKVSLLKFFVLYCIRLVTVKMRARSSLLLIFICLLGRCHFVLWLCE